MKNLTETQQHTSADIVGATATLGVPSRPLQLLAACGAAGRPHSGRTLMHHLVGTYALLKQWGADEDTCLGGLFHSIYGTNAFRQASLRDSERVGLQAVIGLRAELLAWTFSHLDRPKGILDALRRPANQTHDTSALAAAVAPADWQSLAIIECANLLEQQTSFAALREFFCIAMDCPGSLPEAVTDTLRVALSIHVWRPSQRLHHGE